MTRGIGCRFLAVLVLAARAAAQTVGGIEGEILDPSGAAVPGAVVHVRETETNAGRKLLTGAGGRYMAPGLTPGSYRVEVSKDGFSPSVREGLRLTAGRIITADFRLALSGSRESVTISAAAGALDTAATAWGASIDTRQLESLPLNGRDLFDLATQQAGVNLPTTANRSLSAGPGAHFTVNGARASQNGFRLDGIRINDAAGSAPASAAGLLLGIEGIAELRIVTSPFSAEYGRAAGANFTAVSRSGANQFHGSAYEFLRNSALDCKNYFDPAGEGSPPFRRNQFGGLLSGPLRRDQLFFSVNYEGLRERLHRTARPVTISAAARNGQLPGRTVTVATQVKPYFKLYPLPNGRDFGDGTGEFTTDLPAATSESYTAGKVDAVMSERWRLATRYTHDSGARDSQDALHIWQLRGDSRYQFVHASAQYVGSPHSIHNLRAAFSRVWNGDRNAVPDALTDELAFLPGLGMGTMEVTGLADIGGLTLRVQPRTYVVNDYELNYDFTRVSGGARISFGGGFNRVQFNQTGDNSRSGFYRFSSLVNFLEGRTRSFEMMNPGTDTARGFRQNQFSLFLQTEFRPLRRLSLGAGVRYETYSTPTEVNGKIATLPDPVNDQSVTVGGPLYVNPSRDNFAPRLSLAWNPSGGGTVVRAGAGIFFELPGTRELVVSGFRMPPFYRRLVVNNPLFPNPGSAISSSSLADSPEGVEYYPSQPYVAQYQFSVEHRLRDAVNAELGYAGSRGVHLPGHISNLNTTRPELQSDGRLFFPAGAPLVNPAFNQIGMRLNRFDSVYHGLSASLRASLGRSLRVQSRFTWSKSIDNCSIDVFDDYRSRDRVSTVFNYSMNRGLSDFQVGRAFTVNFFYQLSPARTGALGLLLGGWELYGTAQAQDGPWFNPTVGFDRARLQGQTTDLGQRPNYAATPGAPVVLGDPQRWFDPFAFGLPVAGYYGNLGRNTVNGPGLGVMNAALHKMIWKREAQNLRLRLECFNVTNHPNFQVPSSVSLFDSTGGRVGAAGRITETTTTARQVQIAVRWTF
jgi:hypothetical protein